MKAAPYPLLYSNRVSTVVCGQGPRRAMSTLVAKSDHGAGRHPEIMEQTPKPMYV